MYKFFCELLFFFPHFSASLLSSRVTREIELLKELVVAISAFSFLVSKCFLEDDFVLRELKNWSEIIEETVDFSKFYS